jgi:3-phenylpropionate/cinnamic acid dioxygenase small subunit
MLSLQEISDRLEIQELLVRYSHTLDTHDWDAWEQVFTPDAMIDYTETGGPRGGVKETRAFLESVMPTTFSSYQHMIGNTVLEIEGDTARARSILFNPMVMSGDEPTVFFVGLWYRDELVRTSDGWRIKDRYEERSYTYNMPPGLVPTEP